MRWAYALRFQRKRMILIVLIMILLLNNRLSRHCAGIVCTERRRKHGTICTDPEKQRKDQARYSCARMATKTGYYRKRPGNIPADAGSVQSDFKRITGHTKRNYYLGRLAPAFFPCAGALCLVPQTFILRFKTFRSSNVQEYGASRQNAQSSKTSASDGSKNHCTLTIIYIGAML